MSDNVKAALALGLLICAGLVIFGLTLGNSAIRIKEYERTVSVKGLAEREVPADIAMWPVRFTAASDDLGALYLKLESDTRQILAFLEASGFTKEEISVSAPEVTDKMAQRYGGGSPAELRYTARQTIMVYSKKPELVRSSEYKLAELGKKGIALGGEEFQRTEYLFTQLNQVKPAMIEEATRKAREVAEKFAADSHSELGKIRSASQGLFSVSDRDNNTPHIKNVRVVSTVEYYLSD